MKKKHRMIASFLAVSAAFLMLFSVFFIASEAKHDCCGESCPICFQLDACGTTLKSVHAAGTVLLLMTAAQFFYDAVTVSVNRPVQNISLVTLKVKLSD